MSSNKNKITIYPTKIEGYDNETGNKLFIVESFNKHMVNVKIDTVVNIEKMDEVAKEISGCIAQMVNSSDNNK